MNLITDKPYQFVPPHRGHAWPWLIQRLRLVDRYLALHDGVVDSECRHLERFTDSIQAGDAILLAPNHCRYSDPLVLCWPARAANIHLFAMASWHLFAESRLQSFAIQKMGGFSIFREGTDRQSLDTAIQILTDAERPLILFPEGTTNRTNDVLQPLLDGVAFIARTAARRRAKQHSGRVVIIPVAIKYLFQGDIQQWGAKAAARLEAGLGWRPLDDEPLLVRILRIAEALLAIHEVRYLGGASQRPLGERRDALVEHLLGEAESQFGLMPELRLGPLGRIRQVRSAISGEILKAPTADRRRKLYHCIDAMEIAQQLYSYPDRYLLQAPTTDTQLLETLERMQEGLLGKPDFPGPLKAVIEFAEPIPVPAEKQPRDEHDPLLLQLRISLTETLNALASEARLVSVSQPDEPRMRSD
jgi:1-acyl-sn-glycerol-3-phosphate acyltransferase